MDTRASSRHLVRRQRSTVGSARSSPSTTTRHVRRHRNASGDRDVPLTNGLFEPERLVLLCVNPRCKGAEPALERRATGPGCSSQALSASGDVAYGSRSTESTFPRPRISPTLDRTHPDCGRAATDSEDVVHADVRPIGSRERSGADSERPSHDLDDSPDVGLAHLDPEREPHQTLAHAVRDLHRPVHAPIVSPAGEEWSGT